MLAAVLTCGGISANAQFQNSDLFIAVDGNDAWSGGLAEANARRTDGPLASIGRAAAILRQRKQEGQPAPPLTVWIRGGSYKVDKPLTFGPEDSGPITYAAYPGEHPVFDAGTRITHWSEQKVNGVTAWVADVTNLIQKRGVFRSLFVDGRRRSRAHLPKKGFYRILDVPGRTMASALMEGSDSFRVTPGEVRNWKNLEDVEIRVFHFWVDERMQIASVDETTGLVKCSRTSRCVLKAGGANRWADYWVDNVFEALSEPGEWYLDGKAGKLFYVPAPGETPDKTEVIAAGMCQFLRLEGIPEEGKLVTGLSFQGLTFRHSDWVQPELDGRHFDPFVPVEKRRRQDSTSMFERYFKPGVKFGGSPQSAVYTPGAISLTGAHKISIVECRIEHVGYYGINLADGCLNNTIAGNVIVDIGAGGVKIDGANYPSDPAKFSGQNRITDNIVRAGGRVFQTAAGITITHGFSNLIAHNEISDFYQSGIACGWDWGRRQSVSHDNVIEKNHIFNLGQKLSSDMGGVYLLAVQPGTIVRNNLIHDIQHSVYGGWGIYTDAMTAHVVIENNIVYNASGHAIYNQGVHSSTNREITVRNNIFAFGGSGLACLQETWEQKRKSVPGLAATYERNIFLSNGEPVYDANVGPVSEHPRNEMFLSDLNLLWDVSGRPPIAHRQHTGKHYDLTLDQWRSIGSDIHSLVADPKVKDWNNRDFTLAPDSPAFSLGFQPIDMTDVGPRAKQIGP